VRLDQEKENSMNAALANFHILRPHYEVTQEEALEWIAKAHSKAEAETNHWDEDHPALLEFHQAIKEQVLKIGVGKDKVQKRGVHFRDLFHFDWDAMEIYQLQKSPEGLGHGLRLAFFDKASTEIFEKFYPEGSSAPKHLIHVTCTGYAAPSSAQKLVSTRNFGAKTIVTHAYHMGCYGSMPAIRMGLGFFYTFPPLSTPIDIVHTEICSLHMNPMLHDSDQLVIHTLFADGFIKYSLISQDRAEQSKGAYLKILALHEETIPDSSHCLTWNCDDWGMRFTLSREIPVLIARALGEFLDRLLLQVNAETKEILEKAFFAIHPGGPKIIEQVAKILNLNQTQINHSQRVLRNFGNMSSATLPHVWQQMLDDENVPSGSKIVSFAFGPGLSVSGSLFEKAIPNSG
jgi:predicted naringenin-chalcone synthase